MREILTSLNWKQIIIYLIATLFVVMGLTQLSFLTDLELIDNIRKGRQLTELDYAGDRITNLAIWTGVFRLAGLLISGFIIFQLTRKAKHYWTNLLTVLLLGFLTYRFGLLNVGFIKEVLSFGGLFSGLGLGYSFLVNGLVLIGLGLLIFYNRWTSTLVLKAE